MSDREEQDREDAWMEEERLAEEAEWKLDAEYELEMLERDAAIEEAEWEGFR